MITTKDQRMVLDTHTYCGSANMERSIIPMFLLISSGGNSNCKGSPNSQPPRLDPGRKGTMQCEPVTHQYRTYDPGPYEKPISFLFSR
jgi:hypothetical protein